MSHAAAHAPGHAGHANHSGHHGPSHAALLARENITLAPGTGKGLSAALLGLAVIGLGTAGFAAFSGHVMHALAAYHVGAAAALAMSLGGMFLVLVFHLTNAGWSSSIRRQCENLMCMVPWCALLVVAGIVLDVIYGRSHDTQLFSWLNKHMAGNVLLERKSGFLNPTFFAIRSAAYVALWAFLARRLWSFSVQQETATTSAPMANARFMSAWGMLLFALSVAFAGFDWLMSLDFTFFSTMWGVYFFAGSIFSAAGLMSIILSRLVSTGRLKGVVTEEHFHDLGTLMFAFTVFWSYIAFSQYFLIWYSNIPEETAFFNARLPGPKSASGPDFGNNWMYVGAALCIGHFAIPFVILLFREVKRSFKLLPLAGAWMILIHIVDMFWIVRPVVNATSDSADRIGLSSLWIDIAAIAGVLGLFGWLLVRKITSGPLVPLNDPRMKEALEHKNYVG